MDRRTFITGAGATVATTLAVPAASAETAPTSIALLQLNGAVFKQGDEALTQFTPDEASRIIAELAENALSYAVNVRKMTAPVEIFNDQILEARQTAFKPDQSVTALFHHLHPKSNTLHILEFSKIAAICNETFQPTGVLVARYAVS